LPSPRGELAAPPRRAVASKISAPLKKAASIRVSRIEMQLPDDSNPVAR
jgi:hypothetical protein